MKKLSGIFEGILGDIAKRDLGGTRKKEDDSIEGLFETITTHCEVRKDSLTKIMMIEDDNQILLSNIGSYDDIPHTMIIKKPDSDYDIEVRFVLYDNETIDQEIYPYFEKRYKCEMKKTPSGVRLIETKIRRQCDVMNFIYYLIDNLDEKLITYHK